ncbi:two component transcriptional regulator, LuxR family [Limimonas halophila]|uniref:Two component transcriptional regulator, LuxR family n=1 Tax=Limimonas halophila TaxID=1082479 RepID=A0A1G7PB78_9PROT|nr:response regulator transcription factor [Limimonas halophila]SDF83528.1 two component transcriptional regulator, LuxR family [Limimonas halophila]
MEGKIFVADANRLWRDGIRRILDGSKFELAGEADNLSGLTNALAETSDRPELVVVDVDVLNGDVSASVDAVRQHAGDARIVVLAGRDKAAELLECFRAGVDGCLLKDITSPALLECFDVIRLGERVFPPELLTMVMDNQHPFSAAINDRSGYSRLSEREREILACLVNGHSNKAIANNLRVTEATVKVHLKSILRKINVQNRTQAAIWALHNGINQPPATVTGQSSDLPRP